MSKIGAHFTTKPAHQQKTKLPVLITSSTSTFVSLVPKPYYITIREVEVDVGWGVPPHVCICTYLHNYTYSSATHQVSTSRDVSDQAFPNL